MAAMSFTINVKDNIGDIMRKLNDKTETILRAAGEKAEGYAKQDCPVDTGRLRNSITHQEESDATYIGTDVEYGPVIEFVDMPHRVGKAHYLRDSLQDHIPEYKDLIEKGIEAALK